MTHIERKSKKKETCGGSLILIAMSLIPFTLGFLTHCCVCKILHRELQSPVLLGSTLPALPYVEEYDPIKETEGVEEIIPEEVVTEESKAEVIIEETNPVVVEEFKSYYTYTDYELDLLARLICSEGGTESYETKLKIGSVVMNRVSDLDSPDFPDTLWEVIYQDGQFSVTTIKIDGVIMIDRPADEESKRAAKEVLDYGSILPIDVQFFYAEGKCEGNWITSRAIYEVSDNTVFAYIYPNN